MGGQPSLDRLRLSDLYPGQSCGQSLLETHSTTFLIRAGTNMQPAPTLDARLSVSLSGEAGETFDW